MTNADPLTGVERRIGREAVVRRSPLWALGRVMTSDRPWPWIVPVVVLLLGLGLYPFLYNVRNSFREFNPMTGNVEPVGLENWRRLLHDDRLHGALLTSAKYVLAALVIEFVLGLAIAVLLNSGPAVSGLWQAVLVLPMVVPPTVAAVMFRVLENPDYGTLQWILEGLGLVDKQEPLLGGTGRYALAAVLIPEIWQWTPFFVLILLAGLKALPLDPLEAAQVDGAGAWRQFWDITFPMLRPMIAVAVLFRVVDLIKVFDYIFVLTSGGPGTRTEVLSFYAYQRSFVTIEWGYGSVLGIVILVLAIVLANVYVRVFKVAW